MQTIKFQAPIKDGVVHIPATYQHLQNQKKIEIIVRYDLPKSGDQTIAFANVSASTVSEWIDESEDEIWT